MYRNALLLITTFLTALSAGLLFAYACSVNPGLHGLNDVAYLSAMQQINRTIQNPAFFIAFMGPVVLLPWATWRYRQAGNTMFRYLLAATLLYVIGVFGVTMVGNVPLNEALEGFSIVDAAPQDLAAQRSAFESPWGMWHLVRTVAAVAALAGCLVALMSRRKNEN